MRKNKRKKGPEEKQPCHPVSSEKPEKALSRGVGLPKTRTDGGSSFNPVDGCLLDDPNKLPDAL